MNEPISRIRFRTANTQNTPRHSAKAMTPPPARGARTDAMPPTAIMIENNLAACAPCAVSEMTAGLEPLPAAERAVLRYLEHHEGTGITEVGSALNIKTFNVSAAVHALSERGLVGKSSDPREKRKPLLHLTDLARENKGGSTRR
ncbi:MarR family transcriptional regulator [Rhodococcus rhodochrous]|uniref:MarR family transcriptional regulator n=1 Tax=Rhodococcus rhodochrous TaxID=1829 RepID=UPI000E76D736